MKQPPHPTFLKLIAELMVFFKKGFKDIVSLLKALNPSSRINYRMQVQTLTELQKILDGINMESRQWSDKVIIEAFEDAQARARVSMGLDNTVEEARSKIVTTETTRDRVRQLADDTFEDLLQATANTSRKVKRIVREVVAESMRNGALKDKGVPQGVNEITERLYSKGFSRSIREETFIGIVDSRGRSWDLETYARMVVKTKVQQAQVEGARLEALENESDLAVISSHGAEDSCRHFEGLIISMNGSTQGYITLAELRQSGLIFHPNCQHTVHPIGDISVFPAKLLQKHEQAQVNAKKALANPKATKSRDQKALRKK
jgi:Phage minor capsid protein 2